MKAAKKIEVVFPNSFLRTIVDLLKSTKAPGYTIKEVYGGSGLHGDIFDHGLLATDKYLHLFIVCSEAEASEIIEVLKSQIQEIEMKLYASDVIQYN